MDNNEVKRDSGMDLSQAMQGAKELTINTATNSEETPVVGNDWMSQIN
jgi:hypothetical protein